MKIINIVLLVLWSLFLFQCQSTGTGDEFPHKKVFANPPNVYKGHAGFGMMLDEVDEDMAREQIQHFHSLGFGGVFISAHKGHAGKLPRWYVEQGKPFMRLGYKGIEYLSEEFIEVYRAYLDEAEKLGMRVILYDDYYFPTGQVAGQFFKQFPEYMASRLDKVEKDHQGEGTIKLKVPEGTYLGAVLWDRTQNHIEDISDSYSNGIVRAKVSEGDWKMMVFYLNHQAVLDLRNPGIMNYIEKEAVKKFLSISYEKFYQGFGEYFGNVIPMTFYDEPSMHWMDGRIWSSTLNERYLEKYGESPIKYYPSLWYDIGPLTSAARNALLGIRADMYEENFVKQLADWCETHGIMLSGHMDQEERPNPSMANGDLMKVFKHQQIPGADDIFYWGRMNPGYKVVTSSAYNYDKPITWAETYAAYQECDIHIAYKVAMDQYAMGINMQTPFPGGLEKAMSVEELNEFNKYIGRLSYMLQGGRHVSDVAVMYPIASAQAYNRFGEGWEYGYVGGEMPPELDYMEVGETLFRRLRMDFTYLHPQVLVENCLLEDDQMILNNKVNREVYQVIILPGGNTIQTGVAQKLVEFYRNGGKVIATSKIPEFAAEFGQDELVQKAMAELFENGENQNKAGGLALFLPTPSVKLLNQALEQCLPVRDVYFEEDTWDTGQLSTYQFGLTLDSKEWMEMQRPDYNGALTYTHKVKEGKDLYFFSNSSERNLDSKVLLRGMKRVFGWDPHTGLTNEISSKTVIRKGEFCTEIKLNLPSASSLFLVSD